MRIQCRCRVSGSAPRAVAAAAFGSAAPAEIGALVKGPGCSVGGTA
jgi:hypothetical protein